MNQYKILLIVLAVLLFIINRTKILISKEVLSLGEDMIDNYNFWVSREHTYSNENIDIWTANGLLYINPKNQGSFNLFEKIYIKKCIKKSKLLKAISR